MLYFEVEFSSTNFAGFDQSYYFQAESETELENSEEFIEAMKDYEDYFFDWLDEDDFEEYGEDAESYMHWIREIEEEEYLEYTKG